MFFSVILLMIRMKLTQSFFLVFLVWNLFLAAIPYALSTYITSKTKVSKIELLFYTTIWLLFLPNAPYIITDLLHVKISSNKFLWFDVLLIMSFAYNGLVLFFLTILDMEKLFNIYFKTRIKKYCTPLLFILTGFGMYLGRVLRYNSWEILNNPTNLLNDCFSILLKPNHHMEAWVFTFGFAAFLNIGYRMFTTFRKPS